jgi:hypothetical protein
VSKSNADKHLKVAASYIAVAESGDAKRLAYEKAADEILAAKAEDSSQTNVAVGQQIGKSEGWVRTLLRWRALDSHVRASTSPFADLPGVRTRQAERQVPTRHDDRVEMATTLLQDPKVMKAAVAAAVQESPKVRATFDKVVYDHNAERRAKDRERAERKARDGALPLPAYMTKMLEKMNEWTLALASIRDDELDDLPDGRAKDLVASAAEALEEQAFRWSNRLRKAPDMSVIEGRVRH